jgi:hypothetical protein
VPIPVGPEAPVTTTTLPLRLYKGKLKLVNESNCTYLKRSLSDVVAGGGGAISES